MTEVPRFVNQSTIARELGVGRAAVANWRRRYPGSTPEPAAYMDGGVPLWRADQMTEWREFKRRREMTYAELIDAVTQNQKERNHGTSPSRPTGPHPDPSA